jgi:hypothetical protein
MVLYTSLAAASAPAGGPPEVDILLRQLGWPEREVSGERGAGRAKLIAAVA